MLAKTWKTILLIICIIAVLFNIISKIVRAPSFQKNLDKVVEEDIVTFDSTQVSNTLEEAGQSIRNTASEITSAIFNSTSFNLLNTNTKTETKKETVEDNVVTEDDTYIEDEEMIYNEEITDDEIKNENVDNNSDSKFKVSFN